MSSMLPKTEVDSKLEALFATPISRRTLLKLLGLGAALNTLNACGVTASPPIEQDPLSPDRLPEIPSVIRTTLAEWSPLSESVAQSFRSIGELKSLWLPIDESGGTISDQIVDANGSTRGYYAVGMAVARPIGQETFAMYRCVATFDVSQEPDKVMLVSLEGPDITPNSREYALLGTEIVENQVRSIPREEAEPLLTLKVTPTQSLLTYNLPGIGRSKAPIPVDQKITERTFQRFLDQNLDDVELYLNTATTVRITNPDAEAVKEIQAELVKQRKDTDIARVSMVNIAVETQSGEVTHPITVVIDASSEQPLIDTSGTQVDDVVVKGRYYVAQQVVSGNFRSAATNISYRDVALGSDGKQTSWTLHELPVHYQKKSSPEASDMITIGDPGDPIQFAFRVVMGADGTPTPVPTTVPGKSELVLLSAQSTLATGALPAFQNALELADDLMKRFSPEIGKTSAFPPEIEVTHGGITVPMGFEVDPKLHGQYKPSAIGLNVAFDTIPDSLSSNERANEVWIETCFSGWKRDGHTGTLDQYKERILAAIKDGNVEPIQFRVGGIDKSNSNKKGVFFVNPLAGIKIIPIYGTEYEGDRLQIRPNTTAVFGFRKSADGRTEALFSWDSFDGVIDGRYSIALTNSIKYALEIMAIENPNTVHLGNGIVSNGSEDLNAKIKSLTYFQLPNDPKTGSRRMMGLFTAPEFLF